MIERWTFECEKARRPPIFPFPKMVWHVPRISGTQDYRQPFGQFRHSDVAIQPHPQSDVQFRAKESLLPQSVFGSPPRPKCRDYLAAFGRTKSLRPPASKPGSCPESEPETSRLFSSSSFRRKCCPRGGETWGRGRSKRSRASGYRPRPTAGGRSVPAVFGGRRGPSTSSRASSAPAKLMARSTDPPARPEPQSAARSRTISPRFAPASGKLTSVPPHHF